LIAAEKLTFAEPTPTGESEAPTPVSAVVAVPTVVAVNAADAAIFI
jgi:hypothetical protein